MTFLTIVINNKIFNISSIWLEVWSYRPRKLKICYTLKRLQLDNIRKLYKADILRCY